MVSLKEFEKEIQERETLLKNIILLKRDYEFLSASGDTGLIRFISKHPIFGRSRDAIFKLLCIEVHKLFSGLKSDSFKLTQLLEKIEKHRKKADWKDRLAKTDIREIKELLYEGLKSEAIKGLSDYRNKYLAHTDINRRDAIFFVREFYQLIDIALKIINLLRSKVLDEPEPLEMYIPVDGFDKIKKLVDC